MVPCACIYSSSKYLFSIYHVLRTVLDCKNAKIRKKKNLYLPGAHIKDQSKQTLVYIGILGDVWKVLHVIRKQRKRREVRSKISPVEINSKPNFELLVNVGKWWEMVLHVSAGQENALFTSPTAGSIAGWQPQLDSWLYLHRSHASLGLFKVQNWEPWGICSGPFLWHVRLF